MAGFFEKAKLIQEENENVSITENGAVGYRSTGKALLDLNFSIPQMRNESEEEICTRWAKVYDENPKYAIRYLFFLRDIREGLGERRTFRIIMNWMADNHPDETIKFVNSDLIPFYGRWDDLISLLDKPLLRPYIYNIILVELISDKEAMANNQPCSLLAKWLPSLTTSSEKSRKMARMIAKNIGMKETEYRKLLSSLRKYIDVTEVKMADNRWNEIKYEAVPGRASMIYRNSFIRHDKERYMEFISNVNSGNEKMNSGTVYPHELVSRMKIASYNGIDNEIASIEAMWKNIPNTVPDGESTMVVRDGSASMINSIPNSSATILDVADAMSIYFAENLKGEFHNKIITFSRKPQFITFDEEQSTLESKLKHLKKFSEVADTNIEAVFDLILQTAVEHNMDQSELPSNILIISDMEFNECVVTNNTEYGDIEKMDKMFDEFNKRYVDHGYKLPRIIFWNVGSRTGTIPMKENELGVTLVSGYSHNVANMVMSNNTDPYECLIDQIMKPRYDIVETVIS